MGAGPSSLGRLNKDAIELLCKDVDTSFSLVYGSTEDCHWHEDAHDLWEGEKVENFYSQV